jgi:ArsR family transcriptional regulator
MNDDMKSVAKIMKALGDRNRVRIMKLLQQKEGCCVCEIREILGVVQSTVSVHLKILEEADLIYSRRDGKWVNFFLNTTSDDERVQAVLELLRTWMNKDPQVVKDGKRLRTIDRNVLCGTMKP